MNEFALEVKRENYPLGLTQELANQLESWEDHVSALIQSTETSSSLSWIKADILLHLTTKFGEDSLTKISQEINEPISTVANYVRTARAFTIDRRDPTLSFSHHYNASFSDSYDEGKKQFTTDNRYEWVDRASDEKFSTRRLRNEIKDHKIEASPEWKEITKCDHCHLNVDNIEKYVMFQPEKRGTSKTFMLDPFCYTEIIDYIEAK